MRSRADEAIAAGDWLLAMAFFQSEGRKPSG
jgi:hypothetical protein